MNEHRPTAAGTPVAAAVNLTDVDGGGGVVWSASPAGFHANVVVLAANGAIGSHRNDAVDVLVVIIAGGCTAMVDTKQFDLGPATALLVPRGSVRAITAGPGGVRYLTVHAEQDPLTIGKRVEADV